MPEINHNKFSQIVDPSFDRAYNKIEASIKAMGTKGNEVAKAVKDN
jgi:hypothetical protein